MKHLIFLIISIGLYFTLLVQCYAETIYIHTDNLADLHALRSKNIQDNLSVATNLHALNTQSVQNQLVKIRFEYMTTKRSLLLMDKSKNICVVNKVKTEKRLEKYLFSLPINLFLGRRLYQNTSYPAVDVNESMGNSVLLSDLVIDRPDTKIIISAQISYGDLLDAQIKKLPEQNKIVRHSGEHDKGVLAMFSRGRAEFALLYPHQVYDSDIKFDGRSYLISSVPPYILGHLMCSKSELAKAFLKSINGQLSAVEALDELLRIHLTYINPMDKAVTEMYFRQAFYSDVVK